MAEATATYIKLIYPVFSPLSDVFINLWLAEAKANHVAVNPATFGAQYDQAIVYWTCHQLQLVSTMNSSVNVKQGVDNNTQVDIPVAHTALISGSGGGANLSFATTNAMTNGTIETNFLLQTFWGTQFLALLNSCSPVGMVVSNT